MTFRRSEVVFRHTFLVSKLPTTAAGILNFLTPCQAVLDLGEGTVMVC